jgi:formamidopyrimidine-DNA glycosylase
MPELPEVETIARGLAAVVGRRITGVTLGPHDWVAAPPPSAAAHLVGKRLSAVRRHGKRLRLELEPAGSITAHLGMSGQITLEPASRPPAAHTHLRLRFAGTAQELRFRDPRRFGHAWVRSADTAAADSANGDAFTGSVAPGPLGPDALAVSLRAFRALLARPRQIKALLLDQHAISGIGNIYCDEALFAARIHPRKRARSIRADRVRELHRQLRRILLRAIRSGGSTLRDYRDASGNRGRFQERHRVYGREGLPCPRCDRAITRIVAAGRSSHVCTRCQPAPRDTASSGAGSSSSRAAGSATGTKRRRGKRLRASAAP